MASNKEKMKFIEYEKMQNSFSRLIVTKEMEKAEWTVTEKIHGANFSFHINKDEVKVARRRDFLNENENFFNHLDAEFMRTYPEKMRQVFEDVVKRYTDKQIKHITVWGEIFGGHYKVDGETLKGVKKCSPVQLEVLYTPNIEWVAYDISYKTADSETTKQEYLDYDVALDVFKTYEIFHLKPLFVGKMNEALDYNLKFDSTLPKILGFPELPKGSNIVEGVVAKPMKNLKCTDQYDEETRAIVKLKNPGFTETKPMPKARDAKKGGKPPKLISKIMAYATEARLNNAISKHGAPTEDEVIKRIVKEFVDDIFEDIETEDGDLHQEWSKEAESDKAKIKTMIASKANGFIKKINSGR
ncbi:RNA-editing ligase 2, mitochondrial-like isoform X2 [Clytia hemisphaerica]|uniref:RNA ligase (ATP) n=1 Tax=Clytia hemisphaerica TaxID=252671 RepID=A0A7M5V7K1_9CNID